MEFNAGKIDVAVIGGGHAGAEAALAAARLGVRTVLFTMSLDSICVLPCNPSIGGTAKGHLVREIDALGGEMGKVADATTLQSRMLNRGKGPAVHSLRAQVDRAQYHLHMKHVLEKQKNLVIKQAEIVDIRTDAKGAVCAVVTALGAVYETKTVIICTGTYLRAKIFVGDISMESGPDGLHASRSLRGALERLQLPLRRFKTGTPARVHRDSIDFSKLEEQPGDEPIVPFSFETKEPIQNRLMCYIAYTNAKTHEVIRENLHRSAMYGGEIEGIGARYCPSIEDKVVRFSDKERHQIFVEPMGTDTSEVYLAGVSTSLPEDVQVALYRTIKGMENVEIMRNAYAIEYDCVDPLALYPTLEVMRIKGLYGAGQFNGTSGYEEAAAQGLVAGINAARSVQNKEPIVLERSGSYIGTLIDDLVTKGCMDPYRMMTSRSEYRLILRQDNADERLTPLGREVGLISDARWEMFHVKQSKKKAEQERLQSVRIPPSPELNTLLEERGTTVISTGMRLTDLLRRPQLDYRCLAPFDPERPNLEDAIVDQIETEIKYEGYIKKQQAQVQQVERLESTLLPKDIDYSKIKGIRLEAREKLQKIMPRSVGQASRISGVTPADIGVLLIYLEQMRAPNKEESVE